MTRLGRDDNRQRGQMMTLFALVLVVILAFAAIVVDLGMLRNDRQTLANAMDAGALAGGTLMPVDGSQSGAAAGVTDLIDQTVQATDRDLSTSDYSISFRCMVGTGAGDPVAFDNADINAFIPLDCDPSHALGHSPPALGDFIGAGKTFSSNCRPDLGDKCNVVVVEGNVTRPYSFGRVVGVNSGNTGVVTSAACRGLCGELPTLDLDVVLVLDNSSSMGTSSGTTGSPPKTRIGWAKQASNELLDSLAATLGTQQAGAVQYSSASCVNNPPAATSATTLAPLSVNLGAAKTAIGTGDATPPGATGLLGNGGCTPLKHGMARGATVLAADARAGARHVIIILSDGRPWPDTSGSRPNATEIASFRSGADEVYSIAIGLSGSGPSNPDIPLMTSLAKAEPGDTSPHFFRVDQGSDLTGVFQQIILQLTDPHTRLISLYPAPIVTSASVTGTTGSPPVTVTVTIAGQYLSGATTVSFGSNPATILTNSDTSITATGAAGPAGTTVDVVVTTPGGSSPIVPGDRITFP